MGGDHLCRWCGVMSCHRADFARLLTILENREDDLRQIRKNKSRSMFRDTWSAMQTMILVLDGTFFRRRKDMLTDEQRKVLEDWSSKICFHEHVDDGFSALSFATLHARATGAVCLAQM